MILFVADNAGFLFLKRFTKVLLWVTEVIRRNSIVTVVIDKISRVDGD